MGCAWTTREYVDGNKMSSLTPVAWLWDSPPSSCECAPSTLACSWIHSPSLGDKGGGIYYRQSIYDTTITRRWWAKVTTILTDDCQSSWTLCTCVEVVSVFSFFSSRSLFLADEHWLFPCVYHTLTTDIDQLSRQQHWSCVSQLTGVPSLPLCFESSSHSRSWMNRGRFLDYQSIFNQFSHILSRVGITDLCRFIGIKPDFTFATL